MCTFSPYFGSSPNARLIGNPFRFVHGREKMLIAQQRSSLIVSLFGLPADSGARPRTAISLSLPSRLYIASIPSRLAPSSHLRLPRGLPSRPCSSFCYVVCPLKMHCHAMKTELDRTRGNQIIDHQVDRSAL